MKHEGRPYLIFILFSPLHLCWGVGQVLWTFIKLVLHGVDGMAAGEETEDELVTLNGHYYYYY